MLDTPPVTTFAHVKSTDTTRVGQGLRDFFCIVTSESLQQRVGG